MQVTPLDHIYIRSFVRYHKNIILSGLFAYVCLPRASILLTDIFVHLIGSSTPFIRPPSTVNPQRHIQTPEISIDLLLTGFTPNHLVYLDRSSRLITLSRK